MSLSLSRKRRERLNNDNSQASIEESGTENAKRQRLANLSQSVHADCIDQTQLITTERCGKIIRIHLENFMCHSNLVIDFHDRVNFFVGNNGSGKSAIMAALVLGLGSKASATNRLSSMKQFIKTGEKSFKIEITFSNAGPQAYEHEVYGDTITVIRSVMASGHSTLVVKNHNGIVISKKIDNLNRIMVYHNMQVDNPVFVLNQDSAREFLKELNPHKNYVMFLKATQLEFIYEKLYECIHTHKEQQIHLKHMKKKIIRMRDELKEVKKKLDILIQLEAAEEKLKVLKSELAWTKVKHREKELKEFLEACESLEKQKVEMTRWSESKSALEAQLKAQISELEKSLAARRNDFEAQNSSKLEMQRKIREAEQNRSEVAVAIESLKKKKGHNEQSVVAINNHLEQQDHGNIDAQRRENELLLEKYRKEFDEITHMLGSTKRDIKMFVESREEKREREKELREQKNHLSSNLDRLRSRMSSINANRKDKLSPFGEEIVQLVAEIDKAHKQGRFNKKPLGPIGRYIEVPNSKFRNIVENQLRNLVKAFLVDNAKDRQILQSIANRVCPQFRCSIITTKFQDRVYDVRNGCVRPPPETRLLMNEIKCSDPNVMNCLIDRARIEAVLLTDNVKIAEHISSQIENVPANMAKVIVLQHSLEYYPDPQYRIYSLNIQQARYIQVDAQQHVATLKGEAQKYSTDKENVEGELQSLMAEIHNYSKLIDEKRSILHEREKMLNNLKSLIGEIENIDYPEPLEVEYLRQELATLNGKITEIDAEMEEKKKQLNDACQEKERLVKEASEQTAILQNIQKDIDSEIQKINEIQQKLRKMAANYEESQRILQTLREKSEDLKNEKQAKEKELQKLTERASELGDRTFADRDEDEILSDISKVEALPRQRAKITESMEDVQREISEKAEEIQQEESLYETAKSAVSKLGHSLQKRMDFVKQLKQHMVLILQFCFSYLLKARDFDGSVEVDHNEKTLVLSVIPRDKHLDNAISSTRALSGGERSYSTVAFLVSLWACVDHPFYFMDEYDVFTDVVNRDCLNMLLINEGKTRPLRQYSFLTPQDMAIESDDVVKIHRLAPPE